MHRSITKCFDKQISSILSQLYHQSQILRNKTPGVKPRTPMLTFHNHFANILNSILEKQTLWGPYADIKHFLQDNVTGKTAAIATFMNLFKLKRNTAKSILLENTVFLDIPRRKIHDNYQLLKHAGMSTTLIQDNVSLLAEQDDVLRSKIEILQQFSEDINNCIPFLYHNKDTLDLFVKSNYPIQDQMKYFGQSWQVKQIELYAIVSKYLQFFINEPTETAKKIKLLLDHEVQVDILLKYKWPMHKTYEHMDIRIKAISKLGLISPLKPLIFNCEEDVFNRYIDRNKVNELKKTKANQISLIIDNLSKNSGYSTTLVKHRFMISINQCMSPSYTDSIKIINIILNEGYDFHDIIWSMKVLTLSEQLLADRFSTLKAINYKAPFLGDLCLSNEAFTNYVNSKK